MCLREGMGKITGAEKEQDGWRRKQKGRGASAFEWKISISHGNMAHRAVVVTELTCPPDIHSQSSSTSWQIQALYLCPSSICTFSLLSIYLNLHSFILNTFLCPYFECFYFLVHSYLLPSPIVHSLKGFYPLLFLPLPAIFSQWQLSFDSFLNLIFLRHSERTAVHRGPCSNKQEAVWFAEGGDMP